MGRSGVNLAYIQARGGSKRFPRKALSDFHGLPMIIDAIEKVQACGIFDRILVTSDDAEILEIAKHCKCEPIVRSENAASDTATDDDVFYDLFENLTENDINQIDIMCKVYPCIPTITSEDIKNLYDSFVDCRYQYGGIYLTDEKGIDAGAAYMFDFNEACEIGSIALNNFPWAKYRIENACDINTPEDLERAKRMANV